MCLNLCYAFNKDFVLILTDLLYRSVSKSSPPLSIIFCPNVNFWGPVKVYQIPTRAYLVF